MSELAEALAGELRYASVWEDHRLLERALCVGPEDDVLCVASAGDNALALLLQAPRSLTAVDVNPAQLALLRLQVAAIEHLSHADYVALTGYRPHPDRAGLLARLAPHLSAEDRALWGAHPEAVEGGVAHAGRLERYFQVFREAHFPVARYEALRAAADPAAFFDAEVDRPGFKAAFLDYFARENMARRGRHPLQFRHAPHSPQAEFFWGRFRWACTALPVADNPYLERFLTGQLRDLGAGPPHLRPAEHARLRGLLPRLTVRRAEVGELVQGAFSKAALSDVFEYMAPDEAEATFTRLARRLRPGGRLAYWNLLTPRRPSAACPLRPLDALSERLWSQDRAWFYRDFRVEEVPAP